MVKRIWFNRWFSVAYHYMNLIRDNPDGAKFEIYGTHPDRNHMSLQACDYFEVEPVLDDLDYVDYCVDFCKRHSIDVFIPRLKMFQIAKQISRFHAIGTKVMVCEDINLLESLMEKHQFYESVRDKKVIEIPVYDVVSNADQFKVAYDKLSHTGQRVCFKPANGEGGMGFRLIDNNQDELSDLFRHVNNSISFDQVYRILSGVEQFPEIMVMEYLDGYEFSIDCLGYKGELLAAVPRKKAGGRKRLLEEVPELTTIARELTSIYQIPYTFNIQVKYKDGVPKLLEINPRMSGGLHITCLSGVNFPYLAVKMILGGSVELQYPQFDILASHIEKHIIMR